MKIFGVIFFSLIFTVVLFMASTLGMSLLWIEFHNHTGQDPLRLKFVFEDIFLIPNVFPTFLTLFKNCFSILKVHH